MWRRARSTRGTGTDHRLGRFAMTAARCALALSLIAAACGASPPTEGVDVQRAVAEGLCLVQFRPVAVDEVEVVPLDGTRRRRRIPVDDRSTLLSWGRISPDGAYVAGVRPAVDPRPARFVGVGLDGRNVWDIESDIRGMPAISADASRIAFSADGRLTVYDVATSALSDLGVAGQRPSWSPSGDRLAYDSGGADPSDEAAQVFVYDLEHKTTSGLGHGAEASWLPDGQRIAVRVGSDGIDLIDLRTRGRQQLLKLPDVSVPRWSPNGRWMAYTYRGGGRWWQVTEPHQIMLRDTTTGKEITVGEFAKANPADYQWVSSKELCRSGEL